MSVTVVEGAYTTESGVSEERPFDHEVKLHERYPDNAPFIALMSRMASGARVTDPRFYTWVNQYAPANTTLASNYTAASGSMVVASGTGKLFRVGNFLTLPRTGTQFVITGISTDTLSVTVAGEGADANATAGDQVLLLGGYQEGGTTPTAIATQSETDYNLTAIITEAVNTTRTEMETKTRPGEKVGQIRAQNLRNAYIRIQRILSNRIYYGQRAATTAADGKPLRMARGIRRWITSGTAGNERSAGSNVIDVGGSKIDIFVLNDAVAKVRGVGSPGVSKKLIIMGAAARNSLWGPLTASGQWRVDKEASNRLGFRLEEIETSSGVVKCILDDTLSGTGGQNTVTGSTAFNGAGGNLFIVDMSQIMMKWMKPLTLMRGDQANMVPASGSRYDGVVDQYLGESTIGLRFPEAHVVVENFAAA